MSKMAELSVAINEIRHMMMDGFLLGEAVGIAHRMNSLTNITYCKLEDLYLERDAQGWDGYYDEEELPLF